MPTNKPRFTITIEEDLFQRIEDFKYEYRYKNQTQAVLALIEMGLSEMETTKKSPVINDGGQDRELLKAYQSAPDYKKEAIKDLLKLK